MVQNNVSPPTGSVDILGLFYSHARALICPKCSGCTQACMGEYEGVSQVLNYYENVYIIYWSIGLFRRQVCISVHVTEQEAY